MASSDEEIISDDEEIISDDEEIIGNEEGVEGEDAEDVPNPMFERPVYLDPKKFTPEATLNVQLVTPQWGLMSKFSYLKLVQISRKST